MSSSIREQFQKVMRRDQKPTPLQTLRQDGVDHINVNAAGETEIGRVCSIDWRHNFFIPHFGRFSSARAFVNWLATEDDTYRQKSLPGRDNRIGPPDYQTLLMFAKYFQMVSVSNTIRAADGALDLPWVSYRVFEGGLRQTVERDNGSYNTVVREYFEFISKNPPREIFPWATLYPKVLETVDRYVKPMVERTNQKFVPFAELVLQSSNRGPRGSQKSKPRNERYSAFENAGTHTFQQPSGNVHPLDEDIHANAANDREDCFTEAIGLGDGAPVGVDWRSEVGAVNFGLPPRDQEDTGAAGEALHSAFVPKPGEGVHLTVVPGRPPEGSVDAETVAGVVVGDGKGVSLPDYDVAPQRESAGSI